jgi:PAS domain S-box-containing protein
LRELLESARDATLELDGEGRIVLLNEMAERLFGYPRGELLGQTVELLLPDALSGAASGPEWEARRKDGSRFPAEVSLSPLKSCAGFGVTATVRDISERRQEKLRDREFLAYMSQELCSPLHNLIGFAELLTQETVGPLNEKQKRFIGHMRKDSLRLLELITDLVDLSKIEAGSLDLRHEPFHVGEEIEEALTSVGHRAIAKSLEMLANVSPPLRISADRRRFQQILVNLLANAIKFTPENGKVRVEGLERDGFAEISVSDTGIGIAAERRQVIFDKLYQVSAATNRGHTGTGLGLAISKALVEQHGGRIWFESEVGKGSCFTFTIPVDPPARQARSSI